MSEQPKIEFPCDYSIRVVGDAGEDFSDMVMSVVGKHAEIIPGSMKTRDSRNARFLSVTLVIRATGEDQLKALFEDLKATGRVHMVI